jgi:hypothetical protein
VITLLTPTADQWIGVNLMELYMRRQTVWGHVDIKWVVVDDGEEPANLSLGQVHIRRERPPAQTGARSLCENLREGLLHVDGDALFLIEHDDWYHPEYLERALRQLAEPQALLAGDARQRYYHLPSMRYRLYLNRGACLCQTGMKVEVLPTFRAVLDHCHVADSYGVDGMLWGKVSRQYWQLDAHDTVLGIKGLPGRPGLGVGHRPSRIGWKADPQGDQLRAWIGDGDAARYMAIMKLSQ